MSLSFLKIHQLTIEYLLQHLIMMVRQAGSKIKDQTAFFVVTRLQEWSVTVDVRHRAQKHKISKFDFWTHQ